MRNLKKSLHSVGQTGKLVIIHDVKFASWKQKGPSAVVQVRERFLQVKFKAS